MRVDVVHLLRLPARHLHGVPRGVGSALRLGVRRRDVARVTGGAVAHEFAVDVSATGLCEFRLLQHHDSGSLPHHEAVPVLVEGAAGRFRGIHTGGEGLHRGKARDADGAQRGLRPSCDDHVRVVAHDGVVGLPHAVQRRGAGRDDAQVWPLCAQDDRHVGRGHVADHHGDEVGADPSGPLGQHGVEVVEGRFDPALAGADVDAEAIGVHGTRVQLRVLHGHHGRGHGELDDTVGPFGLLARHPAGGIEVLDLGTKRHRTVPQVERRDGADAVLPLPKRLPVGVLTQGDGADGTEARHDHSSRCAHCAITPALCSIFFRACAVSQPGKLSSSSGPSWGRQWTRRGKDFALPPPTQKAYSSNTTRTGFPWSASRPPCRSSTESTPLSAVPRANAAPPSTRP